MKDLASIMMVTYNRLDLTKQTLNNILENTKYPFDLILVDNGSSDGTVDYLRDFCKENYEQGLFEDFKIHCNDDNKGIAVGRNQGLLLADAQTKWLATVDNDVFLPEGWLQECVNILNANRNFGAIGVNMEGVNYPLVAKNDQIFQEKPRGNLGTACMVFPVGVHKMIGFFNDSYEFYAHEDADFGFRIRKLGLKLGYIKEMGKHLGEGEQDRGQYREFKNEWHKKNLTKFNKDCRAYMTKQKSLYIPFKDEQII